MALASLIVAAVALLVAAAGVAYSRLQAKAAIEQAHAAKAQADAATTQVLAQSEAAERQLAEQVTLTVTWVSGPAAGVLPPEDGSRPVHMAIIANRSARPIRNISCRITPEDQGPAKAAIVGELTDAETLILKEHSDHWRIVPPGHRCAFVFGFDLERYPRVQTEARFTDDKNADWEIDRELRLVRLSSRDDW